MEKCIVHLPVEGVTLNDDIEVSLAAVGDDWIESEFQRKSLVHQVLPLLDKVVCAVKGDYSKELASSYIKRFTEELHMRPYMITKRRCVFNKTFLLGPYMLGHFMLHFTTFHNSSVCTSNSCDSHKN